MSDTLAENNKNPADYVVHQADPLNAEPKPEVLLEKGNFTTPKEYAYQRNHGEILHIERKGYRLHIEVEGSFKTLLNKDARLAEKLDSGSVDLDTLLSLGRVDLNAALQCAGNRREEMNERKPVEGIQWGPSTIMNASWSGVPLRNFLFNIGLPENYETIDTFRNAHLHFTSKQACQQAEEYQASIPLVDALEESRCLLLADRMNNEDLPDDHGGPLRLIAPGFIGARSVKWLYSISLRSEQSTNFYMTSDYKKLPSWVGSADKAEWMKSVDPLQQTGLQSEIGLVRQDGSKLNIAGYAFNGSGVPISKVQVHVQLSEKAEGQKELAKTAMEGDWLEAELQQEQKPRGEKVFSWTLFTASLQIQQEWKGKEVDVMCRAESEQGETQKPLADWNIRGVAEESYGRYTGFRCI